MDKKLIFLIWLLSFCVGYSQSDNKRIKFSSQIERCFVAGIPSANCIPLSGAQGKFSPKPIDDLLNLLMSTSESAVDSIYISNDTLYVTFFDTPTIAYYAPAMNGIYSASNNNKQAKVNTIQYPTSGGITWQTSGGLAKLAMNTIFNVPLIPTGSSVNGYALYGLPNASNRCQLATTASSQAWSLGSIGTSFGIIDQTFSSAIRFRIEANGVTGALSASQWLHIQGNGDLVLGQYRNGTRPYNFDFQNIMWTDANGKVELASKAQLMNAIGSEFGEVYEDEGVYRNDVNFTIDPSKNLYIVDMSDDGSVDIDITSQVVGRPYKYIGIKSVVGDLNFVVTGGLTFTNSNSDRFDGVVGNFSYEIIKTVSNEFTVLYEMNTPLGF